MHQVCARALVGYSKPRVLKIAVRIVRTKVEDTAIEEIEKKGFCCSRAPQEISPVLFTTFFKAIFVFLVYVAAGRIPRAAESLGYLLFTT